MTTMHPSESNFPSRIRWRGLHERRSEAKKSLEHPGDVALVGGERLKWMLMSCPDACGAEISLNLDLRAGPAWLVRRPGDHLTLYPSVWRDSGCGSHFVIDRGRIYLFGHSLSWWWSDPISADLTRSVLSQLSDVPQAFAAIAEVLDENPWEVLRVCEDLVRRGFIHEVDKRKGLFVRRSVE